MARTRTQDVFVCAECQAVHPRWIGRCTGCGAWGTVEAAQRTARPARPLEAVPAPVRLGDAADPPPPRLSTGIEELDRVLGGGIVPGSLVLLGGEPGIGKSTLVLQALAHLSADREVLLITGEESLSQVRSRSQRLSAATDQVGILAEVRLESVIAALEAHNPAVCAIDSIQTLVSDAVDGGPGSVSQVRQATAELMRVAKSRDIAMIVVGQVTKDGGIAGPRMLEHMVDCVMTFDGEEMRSLRILRSLKNRFGSTNESGMMEMRPEGLVSVPDPSAHLLSEVGDRVGSCIFPAIEGSRAVLVEIQALVGHTEVVPPRRVAVGVDRTRLAQVIAVLSRHAGLRLGDQDVFVSVAGGARALDPAADLAIALAIVSAHRGVPLTRGLATFGEIGLTGGIRPSGHAARRLGAVAAQGLDLAVLPRMADEGVGTPRGLRLATVEDITAAVDVGCAR
ncbi:MAG: DNA repair protein RadA [Thermoleophilia bacterium]